LDEVSTPLERWVGAGLLSDEQAAAIRRFEAERSAPPTEPSPTAPPRNDRRSLIAEAIGYVGAALAVGALGLLLSQLWDDLVVGGRLTLVALLTVLLAAGATVLARTPAAPLQRLTSVLATGTTLGVAWLAYLVGVEVLTLSEQDTALLVGLAAVVAAAVAYAARPRGLPQVTLLVALIVTVGALFSRAALEPEPLWVGLTFWSVGIAWLLLGTGGWLRPRRVAEVAGGVVGLVAIQVASSGESRLLGLVLALATAGALVGLAITSDRVHHLAVGAVGLFVIVPQFVFELFGDAIGAPATLLVVGLLLVLLAVGLGRARRGVGTALGSPAGADGHESRPAPLIGGDER
jgi:hypothetical protein